ncbi:phospho-sugar mutase [Corynebacterium kozikiae]|uniref:phospho-sugar mutase n=1 Tax=Corynebacterium kozikiae TaxID=2968469 RepID=UPI00211C3826|nr:phospho-sugar mutase [Corynebacterium sp. 76QC2CO]MCQ9343150.1 phospho-sugar mutase [Corynebacterium sp. 76QC2CO]
MTLTFGTAGMRAPVGPALHQINVGQVTRICAAVAVWLAKEAAASPHAHPAVYPQDSGVSIGSAFNEEAALRVVVGYDARYGSHVFATTAAEVLAGAGFEVFLMPTATPTQFIPWLIKDWELDGGIQITASHNPSSDNGIKVYMANGRQLTTAGAREIETFLRKVEDPVEVPRVPIRPCADQQRRYVDAIAALTLPEQADLLRVNSERANIRIAFTAMHGVGGRTLEAAFEAAGFAQVFPVLSQLHPDPTFPTVDFPNPEEPEAVAQLLQWGEAIEADVLIALDPDADRCAVGIRNNDGALKMLRGDDTGALLATRLVPEFTGGAGSDGNDENKPPIVATTQVSSQLLKEIAKEKGWDYRETPTGFKNLMNAAGERTVAYACEEAVGIAPAPHLVDDKDGIATAIIICSWAAELKALGITLGDKLDELHRIHGVYTGTQVSTRTNDPQGLIAPWINEPPTQLAGVPMKATTLPDSRGVLLNGCTPQGEVRVIARSSGTELKAKVYVEISKAQNREAAEALLEDITEAVQGRMRQL